MTNEEAVEALKVMAARAEKAEAQLQELVKACKSLMAAKRDTAAAMEVVEHAAAGCL